MTQADKETASTKKQLHFIAFDVPNPPNYGGIVDVFYKLKSLHEAGVEITFHCFYYRGHNKPNGELNLYCKKVHFYRRRQNIFRLLFSFKPYIVSSRKSTELLANLLLDKAPILFDGLHSCYYLDHPLLADRKKYVRAHNVEHDYYQNLAMIERNLFKREYLQKEGQRLHSYEPILKHATAIFPIAKSDEAHFAQYAKTIHVPPFFSTDHARKEVNKSGVEGRFILFHGNLRVRENELAAKFIINQVAPLTKYPIVIAGKSPSSWLRNEASIEENVRMIASPTNIQMDSLIQYAHINLLISFQQTGVKLKLLHALNAGKHVIINSKLDDAGLFAPLCHVKDTAEEMVKKIDELMKIDFTEDKKQERQERFSAIFDNQKNARLIIESIFG